VCVLTRKVPRLGFVGWHVMHVHAWYVMYCTRMSCHACTRVLDEPRDPLVVAECVGLHVRSPHVVCVFQFVCMGDVLVNMHVDV
jgi:hypothetical protein